LAERLMNGTTFTGATLGGASDDYAIAEHHFNLL
jgi:hypothetical protein